MNKLEPIAFGLSINDWTMMPDGAESAYPQSVWAEAAEEALASEDYSMLENMLVHVFSRKALDRHIDSARTEREADRRSFLYPDQFEGIARRDLQCWVANMECVA